MATVNVVIANCDFGADGSIEVIMTYDDVTLNINGMGVTGSIANRLLNLIMTNINIASPNDVIEETRDPITPGRFDIPVLQRGDWKMIVGPDGPSPETGISFETEVVEKRVRGSRRP